MDTPDLAMAFSVIEEYGMICEYDEKFYACNGEPQVPDPLYYGYKGGDQDYNNDYKAYEQKL